MFSNNNNGSSRCIECVVCKAAGKSDNLGHFIRNDKGTVVCPTLLDQNCRHCGQKGHTPKYCIIKKQAERQERRATFHQSFVATADKKTTKKNVGNAFGALDDDSSDDEDVKKPVSSAAVVDQMTKEEMRQALCDILGVNRSKNATVAVAEPVSKAPIVSVPVKRRLWSEMMDDSDYDDE
jgi:hypothetical protein